MRITPNPTLASVVAQRHAVAYNRFVADYTAAISKLDKPLRRPYVLDLGYCHIHAQPASVLLTDSKGRTLASEAWMTLAQTFAVLALHPSQPIKDKALP